MVARGSFSLTGVLVVLRVEATEARWERDAGGGSFSGSISGWMVMMVVLDVRHQRQRCAGGKWVAIEMCKQREE